MLTRRSAIFGTTGLASAAKTTPTDTVMKLIKSELCRFFVIGFGGGALLVLATIGIGHQRGLSDPLVTTAQAEEAGR